MFSVFIYYGLQGEDTSLQIGDNLAFQSHSYPQHYGDLLEGLMAEAKRLQEHLHLYFLMKFLTSRW